MTMAGGGVPREKWFDEIGGPRGAAFAATALMQLQDSPVDVANYFTGEIQGFGLFNFHGVPRKTFYAVSYTHLRAHETVLDLVCRLLLEKKKNITDNTTDPFSYHPQAHTTTPILHRQRRTTFRLTTTCTHT